MFAVWEKDFARKILRGAVKSIASAYLPSPDKSEIKLFALHRNSTLQPISSEKDINHPLRELNFHHQVITNPSPKHQVKHIKLFRHTQRAMHLKSVKPIASTYLPSQDKSEIKLFAIQHSNPSCEKDRNHPLRELIFQHQVIINPSSKHQVKNIKLFRVTQSHGNRKFLQEE
ncbi:hypothetical protein CDAR_72561 [Caerostris darwini]|uniref:Uncharacterized protein n=1 Tax=Caerostris darwini TaxID=1538125 RepID=A0AAV4MMX0_9ARAC|nr:hypothetical protein CDAR_72561 [Caerostris darwini]